MSRDKIECPTCGSTSVRTREIVHKSGTSNYSGKSSSRGFSFSLSGILNPRVWLGGGSHRGKRQSIKAQEAEPLPFWPAILIPSLVFIFKDEYSPLGGWSIFWLTASVGWFFLAAKDYHNYLNQWICSKCGTYFKLVSESEGEQPDSNQIASPNTPGVKMSSTESDDQINGKLCSICGKNFPHSEFSYGNRDNRSYCQNCNTEEKAAYSQGGTEGARKYREEMRAKWK